MSPWKCRGMDVPDLDATPTVPKAGNEPLHESGRLFGQQLRDFWAWAYSDLLGNAMRGVLDSGRNQVGGLSAELAPVGVLPEQLRHTTDDRGSIRRLRPDQQQEQPPPAGKLTCPTRPAMRSVFLSGRPRTDRSPTPVHAEARGCGAQVQVQVVEPPTRTSSGPERCASRDLRPRCRPGRRAVNGLRRPPHSRIRSRGVAHAQGILAPARQGIPAPDRRRAPEGAERTRPGQGHQGPDDVPPGPEELQDTAGHRMGGTDRGR